MKILQISPTYSGIGGIAQHVRGLEKYLKNSGHQVKILSSDNSFTLPIKGLKNPSFMLSSTLKTCFMKKYDIIHAHNIPSVNAMKNVKGKKILTLHGIFSEQIDILHGKTTGNLSKKYEFNAIKSADAITVVSKEAFDYYSKYGYNVHQIPNAIDISSFPLKKDRRYNKQIIFVGRLSKEKGVNSLLKIAEKLKSDIHLIILGIGPEEKTIKHLMGNYQNIHYLGYQNKENTIALIRGSDILIQPSLVEGISSTILESMACKTPIITSNVGGNMELITNKENGFLTNPNDYEKILENIDLLLSDKQQINKITENAFKTVKNYDWEFIGAKYLELYSSLS